MKKLTDPQKIAQLDSQIRLFWKNIQDEIRAGQKESLAAASFWKEYCGIDFTLDFNILNPACRYMEGEYGDCRVYFTIGNKSFRFERHGLYLIRKRNPHVFLIKYYSTKGMALSWYHRQMFSYVRELDLLTEINKFVIK